MTKWNCTWGTICKILWVQWKWCWISAQNIPKLLPKEELANLLTVEKGKINKDGDMIGTSKTKDMNFKDLRGTLRKMLEPSNILASFLKLWYTIPLNFEDSSITLPINTLFIFRLFSVLEHSCHYNLNMVKWKINSFFWIVSYFPKVLIDLFIHCVLGNLYSILSEFTLNVFFLVAVSLWLGGLLYSELKVGIMFL